MDGYPEDLSPGFEESGAVATPFDVWWPTISSSFPTVPEDVAKHWLHEHWGHSPYMWLRSRNYRFRHLNWPLKELHAIRSRWDGFSETGQKCKEHGDYLQNLSFYSTAVFMKQHGFPPASLVVIDNRDGHLAEEYPEAAQEKVPASVLLMEGHRRFNLCLSLHAEGKLLRAPVWLMERLES